LLIALPVCGSFWAIGRFEKLEISRFQEKAKLELVEVDGRFRHLCEPISYYQELFRRLVIMLKWDEDPEILFRRKTAKCVQFYLFDENGVRVKRKGFSSEFLSVSERFLKILRSYNADPSYQPPKTDQKMVQAFLGGCRGAQKLATQLGKVIDVSDHQNSRLGAWFSIKARKGKKLFLLIDIPLMLVKRLEIVSDNVNRLGKNLKGFHLGWMDISSGNCEIVPQITNQEAIADNIRKARLANTFSIGEYFCCNHTGDPGIRLFTLFKIPPPSSDYLSLRRLLLGCFSLAFLFILFRMFWQPACFTPLSLQLLSSFGFAGAAAVVTLLGIAVIYRDTQEKNAIFEKYKSDERVLEGVDESLPLTFSRLVRFYRSLIKKAESKRGDINANFRPLEKMVEKKLLNYFVIGNYRGEILGKKIVKQGTEGRSPLLDGGDKIIFALWQSVFSKAFFFSLPPQRRIKIGNPVFEFTIDQLSSRLLRGRGNFVDFAFGHEHTIEYLEFLFPQKGFRSFGLYISHNSKNLEKWFLRGQLKKVSRICFGKDQGRVIAFPKGQGEGGKAIPPIPEYEADIFKLNEQISERKIPLFRLGTFQGIPSIISGYPGRNIQEYNLFLVSPLEPILRKSKNISRAFWTVAAMCLVFSLAISLLFSENLLTPMKELASGIERLSRNDFIHPVVLASSDELEKVGEGLNSVMTEMKELSLAQEVYEELLPTVPLTLGGMRIRGFSNSLSYFPGEIFDFFSPEPEGILFFLMSTSSCTISSAFFMVMVKMGIRSLREIGISDPSTLLLEVEKKFFPRKDLRQIQILIGNLDTRTRRIKAAIKGNIEIFLSTPGKRAERIYFDRSSETRVEMEVPSNSRLIFLPFDEGLIFSQIEKAPGWSRLCDFITETANAPLEQLAPMIFQEIEEISIENSKKSLSLLAIYS